MVRTPGHDERGLKKGTWTPEEDRKLVDYVTKYGCWNWRQLPKYAGLSRCGKSCRLRWMNYLRPNVKRGNYSKEEDDLIIELQESLGNRWSVIAAHLPGRTDNEVKNHWHTLLKHRSKQTTISHESKPGSYNRSNHGSIIRVKSELKSSPSFDHTIRQILESSQISQQSSSSESSSTTIATNATNYHKLVGEDDILPVGMDGVTEGDFWTQPFLVDMPNMTTVEPGSLFPSCPISAEDLLCFYGMFDEPIESLQW